MELWQIIQAHLFEQRERERLKRQGKPSEANKFLKIKEKKVTVADLFHGSQIETTAYYVQKIEWIKNSSQRR